MNRKWAETKRAMAAAPTIKYPAVVAAQGVKDAEDIAMSVRDLEPREVWGTLAVWAQDDPIRLFAATVALASMVDIDRPRSELLAWLDGLELKELVA